MRHVYEPTRKNVILDLVLSSVQTKIINLTVSEPLSTSDHNSITFQVDFRSPLPEKAPVILFHKADWQKIRDHLDLDWETEIGQFNAQDAWRKFKATIKVTQEKLISSCIIPKRILKPWWNSAFKKSHILDKRALWKNYRQNPSLDSLKKYRQKRLEVNRTVKLAKLNF